MCPPATLHHLESAALEVDCPCSGFAVGQAPLSGVVAPPVPCWHTTFCTRVEAARMKGCRWSRHVAAWLALSAMRLGLVCQQIVWFFIAACATQLALHMQLPALSGCG
jgi:hypothetical protein